MILNTKGGYLEGETLEDFHFQIKAPITVYGIILIMKSST